MGIRFEMDDSVNKGLHRDLLYVLFVLKWIWRLALLVEGHFDGENNSDFNF